MSDAKVAVITGASRGIGRAIAIDLSRHGFDVVPTGRSLSESVERWPGTLEETAEKVRSYGQRALPIKMDLTNQDEIRDGIAKVLSEFGRIDVLVTSATYIDFEPDGTFLAEFIATRWDSIQNHIDINVTSTLLLARLVLPGMVERRSGIVMNITQASSGLGKDGPPLPGRGTCGMAIPVTRGVTAVSYTHLDLVLRAGGRTPEERDRQGAPARAGGWLQAVSGPAVRGDVPQWAPVVSAARAGGEGEMTPVSYTHLDVYKRQVHGFHFHA